MTNDQCGLPASLGRLSNLAENSHEFIRLSPHFPSGGARSRLCFDDHAQPMHRLPSLSPCQADSIEKFLPRISFVSFHIVRSNARPRPDALVDQWLGHLIPMHRSHKCNHGFSKSCSALLKIEGSVLRIVFIGSWSLDISHWSFGHFVSVINTSSRSASTSPKLLTGIPFFSSSSSACASCASSAATS